MRFEKFSFGSIRIDGVTHDYDVVIDRGTVRKRKKKPSKQFRDVFGHTPLSVEEKILSMANYQFMEQLLGLAVLAKILNEQSRRPFRPRHGYGCPTLGAGRRPFCGRRVRSC